MRAVVMHGFGSPDVLELESVDEPTPADDEVLIRIRATTVTAGDCELRRLDFPPSIQPLLWGYVRLWKRNRLIPGQEVAGEVAAVGADVTRFESGDEVFAATAFRFGGAAEYVALPESYPIVPVPSRMSVADAATIPTGGLNAAHFVRSANVGAGDAVLLNGAGGSIGTYACQLATSLGATVTCVDSAAKLDALRSLGADRVIDYAETDFTATGETYDVVVDIVGASSFAASLRTLRPGGHYVLGNPSVPDRVRGAWRSATTNATVVSSPAGYSDGDVAMLVERIESGDVRAVVDRTYPLADLAEAHRYVESGRKVGNVVVTVD